MSTKKATLNLEPLNAKKENMAMRLLRVDMKNENTVATDLPKEWLAIGGSGLIAKIMNDEVPPGTDLLGPDNKLIIACGL